MAYLPRFSKTLWLAVSCLLLTHCVVLDTPITASPLRKAGLEPTSQELHRDTVLRKKIVNYLEDTYSLSRPKIFVHSNKVILSGSDWVNIQLRAAAADWLKQQGIENYYFLPISKKTGYYSRSWNRARAQVTINELEGELLRRVFIYSDGEQIILMGTVTQAEKEQITQTLGTILTLQRLSLFLDIVDDDHPLAKNTGKIRKESENTQALPASNRRVRKY